MSKPTEDTDYETISEPEDEYTTEDESKDKSKVLDDSNLRYVKIRNAGTISKNGGTIPLKHTFKIEKQTTWRGSNSGSASTSLPNLVKPTRRQQVDTNYETVSDYETETEKSESESETYLRTPKFARELKFKMTPSKQFGTPPESRQLKFQMFTPKIVYNDDSGSDTEFGSPLRQRSIGTKPRQTREDKGNRTTKYTQKKDKSDSFIGSAKEYKFVGGKHEKSFVFRDRKDIPVDAYKLSYESLQQGGKAAKDHIKLKHLLKEQERDREEKGNEQSYERYTKKWTEVLELKQVIWPNTRNRYEEISCDSVQQFFEKGSQNILDTQFKDQINGDSSEILARVYKNVLKNERVRWHPDKMLRNLANVGMVRSEGQGEKLEFSGEDKETAEKVTKVFQVINELYEKCERDKA